jgi:hypothetical protein
MKLKGLAGPYLEECKAAEAVTGLLGTLNKAPSSPWKDKTSRVLSAILCDRLGYLGKDIIFLLAFSFFLLENLDPFCLFLLC